MYIFLFVVKNDTHQIQTNIQFVPPVVCVLATRRTNLVNDVIKLFFLREFYKTGDKGRFL